MSDETQTETPNAEESSVETSQASSTETKSQPDAGVQVESPEKQQTQAQDGASKEGKRRFFQARQAEKQQKKQATLEEEIGSLKATISDLASHLKSKGVESPSETESEPQPVSKGLSDQEIDARIESRLAKEREERQFVADSEFAENWLLTRSHLQNDPNASNEIVAMLKGSHSKAAQIDPKTAAKAAYLDWCQARGVSPDLEGVASSGVPIAGVGRPTSTSTSRGPSDPMNGMTMDQADEFIRKSGPVGSKAYHEAAKKVQLAMDAGKIK